MGEKVRIPKRGDRILLQGEENMAILDEILHGSPLWYAEACFVRFSETGRLVADVSHHGDVKLEREFEPDFQLL